MARSALSYFRFSIIASVLLVILSGVLGYFEFGTMTAVFRAVYIVIVLSLLELSISFENAVVNATILRQMTELWQRRFLTWGILFAVFFMRLVFPLVIVCLSAWIDPISALKIAALEPSRFSNIMLSIHHEVSAFGGAFLAMAALKYFFDSQKEVHWIYALEMPLARMGKLESIEIAVVLAILWMLTKNLPPEEAASVLKAGVFGVITFILVDSLANFLKTKDEGSSMNSHSASFGMFLYLEVLDASFSFDGVIGAFAISDHLFLIAIGLGIGALFVRSLTVLMVDRGTLQAFKFLEQGAFWAVGSLAAMMFAAIHIDIPEAVTSSVGVILIGLSIWSSVRGRAAKA